MKNVIIGLLTFCMVRPAAIVKADETRNLKSIYNQFQKKMLVAGDAQYAERRKTTVDEFGKQMAEYAEGKSSDQLMNEYALMVKDPAKVQELKEQVAYVRESDN